jgi:hypothetical protein
MTIEDIHVLDSQSIEASVFIDNIGDELVITSYQCALSINQNFDRSSLLLYYVEGSSELINEPNLFVGVTDIDGPTELTFVSYIGNDIVNSKTLVGKFVLQGNIDISTINLLSIQWDFEGTISTIITGKNFDNITNPASHESLFQETKDETNAQKLEIASVSASSTTDTTTSPNGVIDGKCFCDGDANARWATQTIPSSLFFDLGEKKMINKTRFSFFYFNQGRTYQYNVKVSNDMENWVEVLSNISSSDEEWSEESFDAIDARYLELEIIGSTNNTGNWANVWEAEIFGTNSTTGIEQDEQLAEQLTLPNEYGISQNYPNPFNPSTKVEVMMKESGSARLDVYNLLGEKVLAILDEDLSAGVHEVSIDGSQLASGIYIYKLDIENRFSQVKKMNLIK